MSGGILQLGSGGTSGSVTGNIVNNANVTFNRSDAHTYSGVMSGTGCYEISFEHSVDGDNTYTGDTTVSAGTLQIGAGGSTGSVTGNIVNNANVTFNRSDALNYAGVISGTGLDGGTFRLTNDNTYTGATILNSGELAIGTSGGSTGSIASQSILFNGGNFYIRRNGDLPIQEL